MKIDVTVNNRTLETSEIYRIPSRSQEDVSIAFHIEPGFGWDALDKTAEFSRVEGKTWKVNIQPDVYYSIPTSAINREGVLYVSLIGCSKGEKLATTFPVSFTVERSNLDLLRPTPYPIDDDGDPDPDAYAQWVAIVTQAVARAEKAAQEAEGVATGWYTKEECDERFAKRVKLSVTASEEFDLALAVSGTLPEVQVKALPVDVSSGTIETPASMVCIEGARFDVASPSSTTSSSYSGFALRRLNDSLYDELVVDSNGANWVKKVHSVKGSDITGMWLTDTQYAFNIITQEDPDPAYNDAVLFNIGPVTYEVKNNSIVVDFPAKATDEQLAEVEIWYALKTPQIKLISNATLGMVPVSNGTIKGFKTMNLEESPLASFGVMVELDITKYLNSYMSIIQDLQAKVTAAEETVEVMKTTVDSKAKITKIEFTAEDFVTDGVYGNHFTINNPNIEILQVYEANAKGSYDPIMYTVFKTPISTVIQAEITEKGYIVYTTYETV